MNPKTSRKQNHEQAPQSAAFVEAMRKVFGRDQVQVLYVEENGFRLGEQTWKPK